MTKKQAKYRRGQSTSKVMLGDFWLLYDKTGTYTGNTLWPTKRMAEAERKFDGDIDGVWRIRKVRVYFT